MNENDKLDALTNQRVSFVFGGKQYTARKATLADIGKINRYHKEKTEAKDDANIELDGSLYILSELMKPDFTLTSDQLAESIQLDQYGDITEPIRELNTILGKLGLKMPQLLSNQNR